MRPRSLLAAATLGFLAVAPARAQDFAVSAYGGYFDLTSASQSAKAVIGSAGFGAFGGELRMTLGPGVFVSAGDTFLPQKTGERVFLTDKNAVPFKLGHPLTLRLNVAFLNAGYRFNHRGFIVPYAGVGGELVSYKEESTVAGITTSDDFTKVGVRFLAGVEVGRGRLRAAAEGLYSIVPSAIGVGGVSQIYGETGIGGFTVLGKIVFDFSRSTGKATRPRPSP
jgi:hypothetical protein